MYLQSLDYIFSRFVLQRFETRIPKADLCFVLLTLSRAEYLPCEKPVTRASHFYMYKFVFFFSIRPLRTQRLHRSRNFLCPKHRQFHRLPRVLRNQSRLVTLSPEWPCTLDRKPKESFVPFRIWFHFESTIKIIPVNGLLAMFDDTLASLRHSCFSFPFLRIWNVSLVPLQTIFRNNYQRYLESTVFWYV